MDSILFITTRNIINTCGELRLIKSRANALYKLKDIHTVFYAFISKRKLLKKQEPLGEASELNAYYYEMKNPFQLLVTYMRFKKDIIKRIELDKNIKTIIVSGPMPCSLIKSIKKVKPSIKITVDIHGANEEFIEYPNDKLEKIGVQKFLYFIMNYNTKKILELSDSTFVVSNALKEHITKQFQINHNHSIYIIPCSLESTTASLNDILDIRKYWRKEFNIDDDTCFFIYSGGVSKWQSIDKVFETYRIIKEHMKNKARLMIMSNQIEVIKNQYDIQDDIILKSFEPTQVQDVLYSGDAAFLLREDSITNKVAFPNKFSEYLKSGMVLIATKNVIDQAILIKEKNIGILVNENINHRNISELIEILDYRKQNYAEVLMENLQILESYGYSETLKPYIEMFNLE